MSYFVAELKSLEHRRDDLSTYFFRTFVSRLPVYQDRGFGTSCLLHCGHLTVSANSEES